MPADAIVTFLAPPPAPDTSSSSTCTLFYSLPNDLFVSIQTFLVPCNTAYNASFYQFDVQKLQLILSLVNVALHQLFLTPQAICALWRSVPMRFSSHRSRESAVSSPEIYQRYCFTQQPANWYSPIRMVERVSLGAPYSHLENLNFLVHTFCNIGYLSLTVDAFAAADWFLLLQLAASLHTLWLCNDNQLSKSNPPSRTLTSSVLYDVCSQLPRLRKLILGGESEWRDMANGLDLVKLLSQKPILHLDSLIVGYYEANRETFLLQLLPRVQYNKYTGLKFLQLSLRSTYGIDPTYPGYATVIPHSIFVLGRFDYLDTLVIYDVIQCPFLLECVSTSCPRLRCLAIDEKKIAKRVSISGGAEDSSEDDERPENAWRENNYPFLESQLTMKAIQEFKHLQQIIVSGTIYNIPNEIVVRLLHLPVLKDLRFIHSDLSPLACSILHLKDWKCVYKFRQDYSSGVDSIWRHSGSEASQSSYLFTTSCSYLAFENIK